MEYFFTAREYARDRRGRREDFLPQIKIRCTQMKALIDERIWEQGFSMRGEHVECKSGAS
jgi:hypothetical protein